MFLYILKDQYIVTEDPRAFSSPAHDYASAKPCRKARILLGRKTYQSVPFDAPFNLLGNVPPLAYYHL